MRSVVLNKSCHTFSKSLNTALWCRIFVFVWKFLEQSIAISAANKRKQTRRNAKRNTTMRIAEGKGMMNQPLVSSIRSGTCSIGATMSRKVSGLWAILLAVLCFLGMTAPSQAQVFTISQSPSNGASITEGTGGTRTFFVRIRLTGGNGGQTYRIFYQAQEGAILFDPQKPPATYDTDCNAFSRLDFDGTLQQADFAGAQNNNFKDLGITIYSDNFDEGNSSAGSPYFNQEFFHVSLLSASNVTNPNRDGSIPQVGIDPDPAVTGDSDMVDGIIVDDDAPPTLTVRQIPDFGQETLPTRSDGVNDRDFSDSFFPEGTNGQNNTVRLYVTGDRVSGKQIQFRWRTFSGTATENFDYVGQDNIVTVAPNSPISKLFDRFAANCDQNATPNPAIPLIVPIIGDNVDETDETFVVDIRDPNGVYPVNAGITGSSTQSGNGDSGFAVTGIIKDDDAPSVTINDTQVTEGDSGTTNATFQVKLSSPSPQSVRVDYVTDYALTQFGFLSGSAVPFARNGLSADYQFQLGSVTFQPGETTKFIAIKVNGDVIAEGESSNNRFERFPVDLFIGNNGQPYQPNPSNDLNDTLGVNITDSQGIAQINDDDTLPQFRFAQNVNSASGDLRVNEGNLDANGNPVQTTANFVVELTQPSGLPISVQYSTSDGTAIDGVNDPVGPNNPVDYRATASTLTFAPGETQQVVSFTENDQFGNPVTKLGIPIFGDNVDETDENFFVNLSNPVNATFLDAQAQAIIVDDDGPFVSVNGGTINGVTQDNVSGPEGDTGTSPFNFTVVLSAPSPQTITVQLSTTDGTAISVGANPDFVPITNQTITFLPGETSKIVPVNINGDVADEQNETFSLNIVSVTNAQDPNLVGGNGDSQAIGTIIDDDATPSIAIGDASVVEGDSGTKNLTFTVNLSAPTFQIVSFNYTTADGTAKLSDNDYLAASGQLVIAAGATTQSFSVPIVGDTKLEPDETFFVNISNVVNADATSVVSDLQAVGTITNDDLAPPQIIAAPSSGLVTSEDGTTAVFTVTLARQPTANVTVQYTSGDTSEGLLSTVAQPAPSNAVTLTFTPANFNQAQSVTVTGVDDNIVDGNIIYLINSQPATSADTNYTGLFGNNVSVTNNDNEVPGFNVTPTTVTTSEDGTTATFTVSLRVAPTANVTVPISSNNTAEATVAPTSLTFTPANFSTPQIVTVTGVDDNVRDGSQAYVIGLGAATSADARYNGLDPADVNGTNLDNDSPGIAINPTSGLMTSENGTTATFTVVLTALPAGNVTIPLSSDDTTEGTVSPTSITFTPANYNVPRTVTVTGMDDAIIDGDITYHIVTGAATSSDPGYSGLNAADVTVVNMDNELPGIRVNPTSITVNENVGTTSFSVVLVTPPTAPVTIPVSSSNPAVADVDTTALTFDNTNFDVPQVVTLTVTNNFIDDGNKNLNINLGPSSSTDPDYSGLTKVIPVTILDNDTAGFTITPLTLLKTTEAGGTAQFNIKLNSQPTGSVTIPLSSSKPTEGTVSPSSVTFNASNYAMPQTVTVTGVDDFVDDGDIVYNAVTAPAQSSDAKYNNLNPADVSLTNVDDDTAGITVTPTSGLQVVERGANATFTIVLNSQPTAPVIITLASNDRTEGNAFPAKVTFDDTNWNVPQTITIAPVNEAVADGNQAFKIVIDPASSADAKYNGIDPTDVSVTNIDDDTAGIFVNPLTPAVNGVYTTREDGARVSFSIKLTSQPTANVAVNITTSDATEGKASPATLTFTAANWNTYQVVFVSGVDDNMADGNINYTIGIAATSTDTGYNGKSVPALSAVNLDNDDFSAPNVAITSPQDGQVVRVINRVAGTASDVNDPTKFFVSGVVKIEILLIRFDDPTTTANEMGFYNPTTGRYEATQNLNTQLIPGSYNAARNAWVANLPLTGTNGLAEGSYRVYAFATDKAGNRKISAPSSFKVDLTPPVVAITTPANGVTLASLPRATGIATDKGSGVQRVEVTVIRQANNANGLPFGYLAQDGSFTSTFSVANNRLPATLNGSTWAVNLPALPPATYSIVAYAFDKGGLGAQPDSHRFTITGANGDEFTGNATFLISVPYADGSGLTNTTTPAKAFSVPPTDPTSGQVNYRLQRYNPITLMYEDLSNTSILRRGEGYALTPVNRGVHIRRPSEDASRKGLPVTVQEFQITLRNQPSLAPDDASNGYNLIGDPFDPAFFSSADWLNARVTANIGGQTFTGTVAQAADRGIVDRRLFTLNSSTNTYSAVTGNLLPFRGYFVRTFVDGVQVNLKAVK